MGELEPEGHCKWTLRLLADKMVELEYVEEISHETVRDALKKTKLNLGKKKNGGGAGVTICSQGKKRFLIALKYEGETEYRYLIASNLTWNMKELIQAYSLRWYIEVFFEDWSGYCGFCSMAKQRGVEGSERPLILSLLFDHCFLFHFRQQLFIENKLPLATLGSLVEKSRFDALCQFIKRIVHSKDPKKHLRDLEKISDVIFPCKPSKKHLNGLNGQMTSTSKKAA